MSKGRPPMRGDERMVDLHVRVPQELLRWYTAQGNRSAAVRRALEQYKEAVDTV